MKIDRLAAQTMAMAVAGARPWVCTQVPAASHTANGIGFGAYAIRVSNGMKRPEGLRGSTG